MAKVAINGLGRIGRAALKIVFETPQLQLVAANDIGSLENIAYLLKFDTVYGRYGKPVASEDSHLVIDGQKIRFFNEKDPAQLPWGELGVDIVLECTGHFTKREDLAKHIQAGAKYAILSAPAKSEDIVTVVHAVNRPEDHPQIIACASCTTNCITPVIEILGRRIGVRKAIMTTLHAYTATQALVDAPDQKDFRRGRAAAANFVPTSTGAAKETIKALPEYKGLFDGIAVRGPVPVGSLADIVVLTARPTSVQEVNDVFREEAASARYRGVVGVSDDPLVSADIIQDARASVVDLSMTRVVDGDLVKVLSWYDNEWGFTSQMVRQAVEIAGVAEASVARR